MALSLCRGDCWKDRDTGEIFCPRVNDWVECCPKKEVRDDE